MIIDNLSSISDDHLLGLSCFSGYIYWFDYIQSIRTAHLFITTHFTKITKKREFPIYLLKKVQGVNKYITKHQFFENLIISLIVRCLKYFINYTYPYLIQCLVIFYRYDQLQYEINLKKRLIFSDKRPNPYVLSIEI